LASLSARQFDLLGMPVPALAGARYPVPRRRSYTRSGANSV
jgi:hypothetical protein